MKIGQAKTIRTYYNLLHIIRLEDYQQTVDKITDSVNQLHSLDELKDLLGITKFKLKELQQKLHILIPKRRARRGLINILGTGIKAITGNMDDNDAVRLNKEIDEIISHQTNIKNEINRQTLINNKMIERFDNITNHINSQQEKIENYLKYSQDQLRNKIKLEDDIIKQMQYFNQINYNIDLLNNHLTNIAESITLSRLNIIPKQILNPNELTEIYHIFQNQSLDIKSIEHTYELLGLQAYYNNSNIIFNVQIPIMHKEMYSLFHLIPLPIEKTKKIITKPYAILNKENIQYFDTKCPYIEGTFYCQESTNKKKINESSCIAKIISNLPAECKLLEGAEISEIIQPEPDYVLLTNAAETTLKTTCEPGHQKINGTWLIHFQNCSIEINGITYENYKNIHWDSIYIYPSTLSKINTTITIENLNLQKLKTYHLQNREAIQTLEIRTQQKDIISYTIITAFSCIITIILIYSVSLKKSKTTRHMKTPSEEIIPNTVVFAPAEETQKIKFLWPSLHSKEGGVTETTRSQPLNNK